VDGKVFRAELVGEGSIDAGGPYREALDVMSKELQSSVLPVLVQSENQKSHHGENQECWVINP